MEAYCVFLMGSFIALPSFKEAFGILDHAGNKVIATSWQSALQCSGPVGALIGVFLAGPLTSAIGYRWATITGLMGLVSCLLLRRADIRTPQSSACSSPTLCPSSLSRSCSREFHGESLSPTPQPIAVKLSHCSLEPRPHRCSSSFGRLVLSSSEVSPTASKVERVPSHGSEFRLELDLTTESPLPCNGCSLHRSPFSSSLRQSPHGGWSEKVDWSRPPGRSSDSVEGPSLTLPNPWP